MPTHLTNAHLVPLLLTCVLLLAGAGGCTPEDQPPPSSAHTTPSQTSTATTAASGPHTPTRPMAATTSGPVTSTPLGASTTPPGADVASRRFTLIPPDQTGLTFANTLRPENSRKYLYNGSGLTVGDYDNDGLPDVFFSGLDTPDRLYRQTAPFRFEDRTQAAGLPEEIRWSAGASFVDLNNDGHLDLYVCNLGKPDQVFMNKGDGTFEDRASQMGLGYPGASVMAAFADIDRDGDLDLYLLTNRVLSAQEEAREAKVRMVNGKPTVHPDFVEHYGLLLGKFIEVGQMDRLYVNQGDGTFVDRTETAGLKHYDMGLGVVWLDHNQDGWPDLYVANDMKGADHLFQNMKDGTFRDVLPQAAPHTPWFSMGVDAGDLNNDGHIDILIGDMASTTHYLQKTTMGAMSKSTWFLTGVTPRQYMRNALLVNTGAGRFLETAYLSGLDSTDWTWAVRIADLDNDGLQDAFFANGHARNANDSDLELQANQLKAAGKHQEADAIAFRLPPLPAANRAFHNQGDLRFEDRSQVWGLDLKGITHGASFVDLDRDGDLDMITNNLDQPASVFKNDLASKNSLLIQLQGASSNRQGLGARVELQTPGGDTLTRELHLAHGYLTGEEALLHFGLGAHTQANKVTVHWPSGHTQLLENLPAGHLHLIREPTTPPTTTPPKPAQPSLFLTQRPQALGLDFTHQEQDFDDYAREPLLHAQLSRLGPGIAVGDINHDGTDDVYLSGAAGQPGALYTQTPTGRFQALAGPWTQHPEREEQGALLIDLDGDTHLDLYVVSGSVEGDPGAPNFKDALYKGDGKGGFKPLPDAIPGNMTFNGGTIAAADVDRDGKPELLITGRTRPGRYPTPEPGRLLSWNTDRLIDVTLTMAPDLLNMEAVSGARWTDLDNDGWIDLVLATEWGPVRLLANSAGKLIDQTQSSGLAGLKGWWNGVEAGDLDGDGDIDLVATNLGLNTKYHTTNEHPVLLYVGDVNDDGKIDLIEAEFEDDTLYPVRGLSCSSSAIPTIKDEFKTYDAFARATLQDIYTPTKLASLQRLEANHLSHTAFLNDGTGRFTARLLPTIAQAAPGYGLVLRDFDGDGDLDLFVAQNWFSPQPETGRFDGGLSLYLQNSGSGTFEPVWPDTSGVLIPEDAKAAVALSLGKHPLPHVLVGLNHNTPRLVRNLQKPKHPQLRVQLTPSPKHPLTHGAHLTLHLQDGRRLVRETSAGGGYLSQSTSTTWFALPSPPSRLEVRWPDGATTTHTDLPPKGGALSLK